MKRSACPTFHRQGLRIKRKPCYLDRTARRVYDTHSQFEGVSALTARTPREIDLHGKNVYQATVALDSALRRADDSVYRIRVVHGYHGGEALRELEESYKTHPRVKRIERGANEGCTEIILREY